MRCGLGASLILGISVAIAYGRTAVHDHPVNLHAAHAAQAADVAEQAAAVAKRVAAHTEAVAHDTAAALRYTQDALNRANANADDIASVGSSADRLEEEAGIEEGSMGNSDSGAASGYGKAGNTHDRSEGREGSVWSSNLDTEEQGSSISKGENDVESSIGGGYGSNGEGSETNIGPDGRILADGEGGGSASGSAGGSANGDAGRSLDVNSEIVPYPNGVEPFGQEEPAKVLTKQSVKQSDSMVDKIENAQGTEAKRSVYRALTKLRGATIASYDGIAKGHLKNVENYNKKLTWRELHPMKHLAEEEADTHIWAFPKKSGKKAKPAKKTPAASPAPAVAGPASPAAAN